MRNLYLTGILLCVIPLSFGQTETELLGEGNDGNRSTPVHLIELFDKQGIQIRSTDEDAKPISLEQTCGKCHRYETIRHGWHFNAIEPNVPAGRPGQPWILTDSKTRTQIPISDRSWLGAFTPEQAGLSGWDMLNLYGSHFPGGSYGLMDADPQNPQEMIRQDISGKYEINCLLCHNQDPQQDASMAALQAARQNFDWVATASSGLAVVNGTASALSDFFDPEFDEGIKVTYNPGIFNKENMVFMDITGRPTADRCYFCHSNQNMAIPEDKEWTRDEDVHLKSGLTCTDCHRNGKDHMIARGYETDPEKAGFTCEGCHWGHEREDVPEAGRHGAPYPVHKGIPAIHFEELTCTACHTGPWPEPTAVSWRTARAHKIGLHGKHKVDLRLPHIYGPVLMRGQDDKIGPYRLFWPAYWGAIIGDEVTFIPPDTVMNSAKSILSEDVEKVDDWKPLTEDQIVQVLEKLAGENECIPVYIAGGLLYQLDENGQLLSKEHDAAKPYAWPMAHDVRSAEQSLGVRKCADCHTMDAAFFFGKIPVDTPVAGREEMLEMIRLQGLDRLYMWLFNGSFVFRPFLKIVALAACSLIGLVLLAYAVKAVWALSSIAAEDTR